MPPDAVLSTPALLVRLRPTAPWRLGPDCGSRDRVEPVCHSDTLYSAVCSALDRLGMLEEWLAATAAGEGPSQVRFSSAFPFLGDTLFVAPPRHLWPPPPSSKVRWKGARFVPLNAVGKLLEGAALSEENWVVDGASGCLLPLPSRGALRGPFRIATRPAAAVDRQTGAIEPHLTACLEFCGGAGLWFLADFASAEAFERWSQPVRAAFRLLADSGIGGERSRGWGRSAAPEFETGCLPEMIFAPPPAPATLDEAGEPLPRPETAWWLLSLLNPADSDRIDWQRGCYSIAERSGRIESPQRWGELKRRLRLIAEGSVLVAGHAPAGTARDVAPEGFPHPVYRAGFGVAIPIPYRGAA
ncbi:MAG: type III-A CRISPR-associated RAMP protein Csm4 [Acidobacteria bacterium]|nr:type III-A CRISPR-associated RAMP protein Csm4 [Acidobacteriota bacterium]